MTSVIWTGSVLCSVEVGFFLCILHSLVDAHLLISTICTTQLGLSHLTPTTQLSKFPLIPMGVRSVARGP